MDDETPAATTPSRPTRSFPPPPYPLHHYRIGRLPYKDRQADSVTSAASSLLAPSSRPKGAQRRPAPRTTGTDAQLGLDVPNRNMSQVSEASRCGESDVPPKISTPADATDGWGRACGCSGRLSGAHSRYMLNDCARFMSGMIGATRALDRLESLVGDLAYTVYAFFS